MAIPDQPIGPARMGQAEGAAAPKRGRPWK
jgi:hypothetical protein